MNLAHLESKMARGSIDLADIAGAADMAREYLVDLLGDDLSVNATSKVVSALEELDAVVTALVERVPPAHATTTVH